MRKRLAMNQTGDTIIEVLISMSILTLVLITTYVSVNHSLRSGIDASNRQQALSLASQQVEIIKNASASYQAALSAYTQSPGTPFCIDTTTNLGNPPYGYQTSPATNALCKPNSIVNLSDTYSSGLFTINATWLGGTSGSTTSQLTLYYR